jgi:amino acid adenylation domain-containing protein
MDYRSLKTMFENQVALHPERLAATCCDEKLTFADLNRRSNQLAHALRRRGVTADVLVGVCMHRSLEMLVAVLAIVKAGGAYLPLDPGYPPERLAYMVEDSRVRIVLTAGGADESEVMQGFRDRVEVLQLGWPAGDACSESEANLPTDSTADELAYVIYTSGSTGKPKGVLGTHGGMLNRLRWMWATFPYQSSEVGCVKTSLNFLDSFCEIFGPLLQGVSVTVIPEETVRDAGALVEALERSQVTRLVVVPSLLRAMLENVGDIGARLKRLTLWVTSGEALVPELARRFRETLPLARLLNLYGASEVSADCSWYEVNSGPAEKVAIGAPIANNELYVLDANLEKAGSGAAGELYVGGAGLARGYLGRPELTAERFVPDPFGPAGSRMYRTGDLARWRSDEVLDYLGRSDQQVKIRGVRVELGEIEAVLQRHPWVGHAAVIARETRSQQKQLVGYVVPVSGQRVHGPDLRRYLAERLPDYMVPGAIVPLAALPLTPSGKLDQNALPAPESPRHRVAPGTPAEEILAGIFADVLELEAVSIDDRFSDLGGDSLSSLELVTRARAAGLAITPNDVFRHQSVQALAAAAVSARAAASNTTISQQTSFTAQPVRSGTAGEGSF